LPRSDLEAAQLQGTCWCLLEAPVAILVTSGDHWAVAGICPQPTLRMIFKFWVKYNYNWEKRQNMSETHQHWPANQKMWGNAHVCVRVCVCSCSKGGIS
jgi:hypothetical protein